ncbi:MAG: acyltransferase, partial [Bacteroidota bacterium]|nr:acyltransferase [Bacteroidota bacterium]
FTEKCLLVLWGNGTVLFVFIAGYLFQHLSRKFEYKDYLRKKLQNVMLPYLIVSAPIIVYRLMAHEYPGYITDPHPAFATWPVWERVAYFLGCGAHLQPLWFIPMIAIFYVAAPLFIYIDRHPKWYYILPAVCVVSWFVEREPFSDIPKMFVHFFSVYVFGMFLSRYKKEYLEFAKKYYVIISIATVLAFAATLLFYTTLGNPLNYVHKMLFCCFFIYWLWRLERYVPPFFNLMADLSFGLYFLHYYTLLIVKAVYERSAHHAIPGNILYWTADLLLVLFGTIVVIQAVKRLAPKKSRYLIGC